MFNQIYKMIKQNIVFCVFFTIILTPSFSQKQVNRFDENGKRHGLWEKTYPQTNNQLRYQGQFHHGKEIDTFKYYKLKNKKSVLSAIKVFNVDNDITDVTFFTSNGKIISKGQMNAKLYIGEWLYYHKNSDQLMTVEQYNHMGNLNGKRIVYFKNGTIAESQFYNNGKREGLSEWFSENGILLQASNYQNDKLNGKSIYYNANGTKVSEGNYTENLKTGIWQYYKNGSLVRTIDHSK